MHSAQYDGQRWGVHRLTALFDIIIKALAVMAMMEQSSIAVGD